MSPLETTSAVAVSLWLPDVFARLYQSLQRSVTSIFSNGWHEICAEEYRSSIDFLRRSIDANSDGNAPTELIHFLKEFTPPEGPVMTELIVAQAIDDAFGNLRRVELLFEHSPLLSPAVDDVRTWYRVEGKGNCSKTEEYIVVPAEPPLSDLDSEIRLSGDSVFHLFRNLRVLARSEVQQPWKVISAPIKRRAFNPEVLKEAGSLDRLRVAVVPLAEGCEDASLVECKFHGESRFTVQLDPEQEQLLMRRAGEAIRHAAEEGAHIIIMPEWIVSQGVQLAISAAIRGLEEHAHGLQLVVAGTGFTEEVAPASKIPYAECVVFDSRGETIWTQQKMHHWVMNEEAQRAAGFEADPRGRSEHFSSGDTLVFADTPIGRCVVLICEDSQQDYPSRHALDALRPRWVFIPVLDTTLEVWRWSATKAHELARRFEANIVVANSMALSRPPALEPITCIGWLVSRLDAVNRDHVAVKVGPRELSPSRTAPPIVKMVRWLPEEKTRSSVISSPSGRPAP